MPPSKPAVIETIQMSVNNHQKKRAREESHDDVTWYQSELNRIQSEDYAPKSLVKPVAGVELPAAVKMLVGLYTKSELGKRNPFLWLWLQHGTHLMELPDIPSEHLEAVHVSKMLLNMLNVVTDDIGDELKDPRLLKLFGQAMWPAQPLNLEGESERTIKFLEYATALWSELEKAMTTLPRYDELKDILEFDVRQMLNEKTYSALVNTRPAMVNRAEHSRYGPHTMHGVIFLTLDAMAKSSIDLHEIGVLREMYWDANHMANIANCLATWRREIPARDWSSPIFPLSVSLGILSIDDLHNMPTTEIEERVTSQMATLEKTLLMEWLERKKKMLDDTSVKTVDMKNFAQQNEDFLQIHLACRGLI